MTNQVLSHLLMGLISLLVGLALMRLERKVRLTCWLAHEFTWRLPGLPPPGWLYTHAVAIQNFGRKSATDVELVHATAPELLQLSPALDYEVFTTPTGEHGIRLGSLGPGEYVTVEFLSINSVPRFLYVRSPEGQATVVQARPTIPWPKWRQRLYALLVLMGIVTSVYLLVRLLIWLSTFY